MGEYNEQWNNHGWKQYLDTSKITKQLKSSSLASGAPRGAKRKELQKHTNESEEDDEKEEGGPLKLMKYIDPSNSPSMEAQ